MLLFGVGWTSAYATIQAAAQLVCPPWVRARALAIYQLAQNGALTARLVRLGLAGRQIGLPDTLAGRGGGRPRAGADRPLLQHRGDRAGAGARRRRTAADARGAGAELMPLLRNARGPGDGDGALPRRQRAARGVPAAMAEVRNVRGRAGAMFWQLYEDVAHPEGWMEVWSMESWTDHLREVDAAVRGRQAPAHRALRSSSMKRTAVPATWRSIHTSICTSIPPCPARPENSRCKAWLGPE